LPKAYWIAHVSVSDFDAYARYAASATAAFESFGGRVLARGGRTLALEGEAAERNVVIEFQSLSAAQSCYNSPAYQAARVHRFGAARIQLMLVEGPSE
jgi:uncharacterized protein (DUF1330 family)